MYTKLLRIGLLTVTATALLVGCTAQPQKPNPEPPPAAQAEPDPTPATPTPSTAEPSNPKPSSPAAAQPEGQGETERQVRITDEPESITVLVNKTVALPEEYVPSDLVEPNVRFIFEEKHEKRLMRAEAARALESLFAAAEKDGIYLAGVSGYRTFETQNALFTYYVNTDGEELARRYSAEPGQSEHQTGLAMDVSGSTGACAADDCFAGTPEAEWLAAHAHEHGFIIRYPEGKEGITGYMYEPWHVRYLGKELAADVYAKGVTYEEYLGLNP